jgi:RNA polymerase sigma-70 factor (ECF subfamily)
MRGMAAFSDGAGISARPERPNHQDVYRSKNSYVAPAGLTEPTRSGSSGQGEIETTLNDLVARAVCGDQRATQELLATVRAMVLPYCRARLARQHRVIGSAEDVAQDICLAVLTALARYQVRGLSFRAFVYGIAAHKVTDAFRAGVRDRSEPMAEVDDAAADDDGPEQRVLQAEQSERLGRLLAVLSDRQREILVLRVGMGLSAAETAQVVGSTPGAVRVLQHRALTRLRVALTDDMLSDPDSAASARQCQGVRGGGVRPIDQIPSSALPVALPAATTSQRTALPRRNSGLRMSTDRAC